MDVFAFGELLSSAVVFIILTSMTLYDATDAFLDSNLTIYPAT